LDGDRLIEVRLRRSPDEQDNDAEHPEREANRISASSSVGSLKMTCTPSSSPSLARPAKGLSAALAFVHQRVEPAMKIWKPGVFGRSSDPGTA
jgi:hypothetical protein